MINLAIQRSCLCITCPKEWNAQSSPGSEIRRDHLISARRQNLMIVHQNKGLCRPGGLQNENQWNEKRDKYLHLARELKKRWNMKVTVMPIVIGAVGTIPKDLVMGQEKLEIGGRAKTTALLRTVRILRRVLEIWEDLSHSDSIKNLPANAGVKNS